MASIIQTGPKSWRVQIRRKGFKTITKTFSTESKAEKFAARAEAEIEDGKAPSASGMPTLNEAIEAFREMRENGGREVRHGSTEFYMLRHLEEGLGKHRCDALTPQRIATWARTRADEGAGPATISMEVSKLGTIMRHAGAWLHTALPDPVTSARPLLEYSGLIGPSNERSRRPSTDELGAIMERACPTMQDLITAAILTTMRRGELCRILWADLDEERRLVLVRDRKHPRKKTGNHMWCPLLGDALKVLSRQPRVDERIFPVAPEWVSDTFKSICDELKIEDLHFHDLRHEGTSRLFERGYTIEQVRLVTGHKKIQHLMRYTNLRPEQLSSQPEPSRAWRPGTAQHLARQQNDGPGPGMSAQEIDPR